MSNSIFVLHVVTARSSRILTHFVVEPHLFSKFKKLFQRVLLESEKKMQRRLVDLSINYISGITSGM